MTSRWFFLSTLRGGQFLCKYYFIVSVGVKYFKQQTMPFSLTLSFVWDWSDIIFQKNGSSNLRPAVSKEPRRAEYSRPDDASRFKIRNIKKKKSLSILKVMFIVTRSSETYRSYVIDQFSFNLQWIRSRGLSGLFVQGKMNLLSVLHNPLDKV